MKLRVLSDAEASALEGRVAQAVESFERPDVCTPCGGACCKRLPGAAMPEDFGAPDLDKMRARIDHAIASRRWAIDWWEDDDGGRGYFLRPATVGNEGVTYDPSWGGVCTFHTPNGCSIFAERPSGCRGLEPDDHGCTVRHSGKEDAANAWRSYRDLLAWRAGHP